MEVTLEVSDELLKSIKETLRVTHSNLDDHLRESTIDGMAELQSLCGPLPFDGTTILGRKSIRLLKEYCLYSWNDLLSIFQKDHISDIISLQLYAVLHRGGE